MSTYVRNTPLNSDSPGIFPGQARQNFNRLAELIEADHQFNDTVQANDGYHNLIHMTQQDPTGALAGIGRLYAKTVSGTVQLFYMDDLGTPNQITPRTASASGLFAAVNFDGTGGVGNQTIRSQFNVANVHKFGTGDYQVVFSVAAPNNNYVVQVTGMRNQLNATVTGQVSGTTIYANSMATTFVHVKFSGNSGSLENVLMGSVAVYLL